MRCGVERPMIDIRHASLTQRASTVCDWLQEHAGHDNVRATGVVSMVDVERKG